MELFGFEAAHQADFPASSCFATSSSPNCFLIVCEADGPASFSVSMIYGKSRVVR